MFGKAASAPPVIYFAEIFFDNLGIPKEWIARIKFYGPAFLLGVMIENSKKCTFRYIDFWRKSSHISIGIHRRVLGCSLNDF